MQRPQKVYEEIFQKQGLPFLQNNDEICISSSLKPDNFVLKGDISSQFISGLLFTLPLLKEEFYDSNSSPLLNLDLMYN